MKRLVVSALLLAAFCTEHTWADTNFEAVESAFQNWTSALDIDARPNAVTNLFGSPGQSVFNAECFSNQNQDAVKNATVTIKYEVIGDYGSKAALTIDSKDMSEFNSAVFEVKPTGRPAPTGLNGRFKDMDGTSVSADLVGSASSDAYQDVLLHLESHHMFSRNGQTYCVLKPQGK